MNTAPSPTTNTVEVECPSCHGTGKILVAQAAPVTGTTTFQKLEWGTPQTNAAWGFRAPTPRQVVTLSKLKQERQVEFDEPKMGWQASNLIGAMLKMPKVAEATEVEPAAPAPEPVVPPQPTVGSTPPLPKAMVDVIADGRYAVTADDMIETVFIRKITHKPDASSKYKGATVIQHRVADNWNVNTVYWPSGSVSQYHPKVKGTHVPELLAQIFTDQQGAAHRFAQREEACMSCGTNLTDKRSRWYGIGPECEKSRPDVIGWVTDNKGPYVPSEDE